MGSGIKPLEFNDFSGGLTDNYYQGDTKRYARADNYLITVDKKLTVRNGVRLYDPSFYRFTSSNLNRVSSLFTAINESLLFAQAERGIYTQPNGYATAWSEILGPSGNKAVYSADYYSQVTTSEFQRQIYFTSDYGTGSLPGKIFKDLNNNWTALTAGLPKVQGSPNYDNATILSKCIILANSLRSALINHITDNAGLTQSPITQSVLSSVYNASFQHAGTDKYSLCYLQAVSFLSTDYKPSVIPTPAPAASDLASLVTLCAALGTCFESHRNDLAGGNPAFTFTLNQNTYLAAGPMRFHWQCLRDYVNGFSKAFSYGNSINYKQEASSDITYASSLIPASTAQQKMTAELVAAQSFLDDLVQKMYFHMLSPESHSATNDYGTLSRYVVPASSKIGTITGGEPLVTPQYFGFIDFVNYLRKSFDNHVMQTDVFPQSVFPLVRQHSTSDATFLITLPFATDYDSAVLNLFWLRYLYNFHMYDFYQQTINMGINFTLTAGSNTITNVKTGVTAVTLLVGSNVQIAQTGSQTFGQFVGPQSDAFVAKVLSSSSGSAVLSKVALSTVATSLGASTYCYQHPYGATSIQTTSSVITNILQAQIMALAFNSVPASANDLASWITYGQDITLAFGAHITDGTAHTFSGGTLATEVAYPSAGFNPFTPLGGNPFYIPSAGQYSYAFTNSHTYMVETNGVQYTVKSNPIFPSYTVTAVASNPIGTVIKSAFPLYYPDASILVQNPVAIISRITPIVNDNSTNYDTANIVQEIYRTTSGGVAYYLEGQVANGVTTYTDLFSDTTGPSGQLPLNQKQLLYTNGGILGSDQPPACKYTWTVNGYTYYAGITDSGQFLPNRIRQSIQLAPDWAPATAFDDLEDAIVGGGSARNVNIALCKTSVYRLEGAFGKSNTGSMVHQKISTSIGCLNAKSIVQTEIGLFFAGSDGFYYTDGYQVIKVSIDLNKSYQSFTSSDIQKQRITGSYDKLNRRIYWSMQSEQDASEKDFLYVFYLDYGVKPSGAYTKIIPASTSWLPSAHVFYNGKMVIGDSRGYILTEDPDKKTDPVINTSVDPSLWNTAAIPFYYKSCALDFGTMYMRKFISRIHFVGNNVGNSSLQVVSISDNNEGGDRIKNLAALQYVTNVMWGDPNIVWGNSSCVWNPSGSNDQWRRFAARTLRSSLMQIAITPGNFVIYRSDNYESTYVVTDGTAKTAVLSTALAGRAFVWPLDVVGMTLSLSQDGYVNQYVISAVSTSTITVLDPGSTFPTSNNLYKWQIEGQRKEARHNISDFVVHFSYLGTLGDQYKGESDSQGFGGNK